MSEAQDNQKQNRPIAYYTIKKAAEVKQLPYWKLNQACGSGLIPTYTLGNSRRYVRLEEIDEALQKSRGNTLPEGCIIYS